MFRTEVNVTTNEVEQVPLTAEEIAEAQVKKAAWDIVEAERLAKEAIQAEVQAAKQLAIVDGLPSAVQVKAAIDNAFPDAKQNAFMTKFVRVVYLDLKNSVD